MPFHDCMKIQQYCNVLLTSKQHMLFSNSTSTGFKGNLESNGLTYAMPFPVMVWHGIKDVLLDFSANDTILVLPGNIHTLFFAINGIEICCIYVVPPQSWGDQGDTKHSKCLLVGGRRLNQNDFNPQTERKWRRTGCNGPSRPSK